MKTRDQPGPRGDHRATHQKGAEYAPEQHSMLILQRHSKVREHQQEHEYVVDRQRLFDQVSSQKLETGLGPR